MLVTVGVFSNSDEEKIFTRNSSKLLWWDRESCVCVNKCCLGHFQAKHQNPCQPKYNLHLKEIYIRENSNFWLYNNPVPRAWLVGLISQTLSVLRNPCWTKTALLLMLGSEDWPLPYGIRCNSRIYPSSVVTWCTSTGYPRLAIIST